MEINTSNSSDLSYEKSRVDITCTKCKKKRALTESDAHSLFGMNNVTNKWCKQCVECREKYKTYHLKNSKTHHKCEHNHFKNSCALCGKRCKHNKFPSNCLICRPERAKRVICEHQIYKLSCKLCNLCTHGTHKKRCKQCIVDEFMRTHNVISAHPISFKDKINENV